MRKCASIASYGVFAALTIWCESTAGDLLATGTFSSSGLWGVPVVLDECVSEIAVGGAAFARTCTLFDNSLIDASDVGLVLQATAANSPDWGTAVALLTGNPPEIPVLSVDSQYGIQSERSITMDMTGLLGATITSIELEFADIRFMTPGIDFLGNGVWTDVAIGGELRVYGVVPEPSGLWGLLGMWMCLKRAGRRRPMSEARAA